MTFLMLDGAKDASAQDSDGDGKSDASDFVYLNSRLFMQPFFTGKEGKSESREEEKQKKNADNEGNILKKKISHRISMKN